MSGLSIRVKVTLAFAVVMALVLVGTGLFVYLRLGSELDRSIDQGLRSRAGDVAALIQQADTGLAQGGQSTLTERGESFAQVLDSNGRIVDSTPQIRSRPTLSRAEVRAALKGPVFLDRSSLPGLDVRGGRQSARWWRGRVAGTPRRRQGRVTLTSLICSRVPLAERSCT